MPALFQFPFLFGVPLLPARRVIAIDPGSRVIKLVLAEVFWGRTRVLRRETLENFQDKNDKHDETAARLQALLKDFGPYPVALAFPQHLTISQVIELPVVAESEVQKLIENETVKLGGLSETRIVYDYAPLIPFGGHQHSYWITLCQENEFAAGLKRLMLDSENICDATSVGNALRAAYLWRIPATTPTVLADIGMRSTTIVILYRGQAVQISSFALGAELIFESIAGQRNGSLAQAAELAAEKNLFEGPEASAEMQAAVSNWCDELIRVVREWIIDHNELNLDLQTFQFVLSGGGAVPTGLTAYLNRRFGAKRFTLWPEADGYCYENKGRNLAEQRASGVSPEEGNASPPVPAGRRQHIGSGGDPVPLIPPGHFAVATGAALQALEKNPQSASLLPENLRVRWREQKVAQRLQSICFLLLFLLATALGVGTWQKLSLSDRKQKLLVEAESALRQAADNEQISRELVRDYERIRPALERQRRTLDILQTLNTLQQVRSNRALWFGLFADGKSYFSAPVNTLSNDTALNGGGPITTISPDTNRPAIQPDLIAEVGIPEGGEAMRRILSQLVSALKQSPRFRNVDILPADQRRALEDPRLVIPDHYFAIAFELAENEFNLKTPVGEHARSRASFDAPSRPASGASRKDETDGKFPAARVSREGTENSARGRAPAPARFESRNEPPGKP